MYNKSIEEVLQEFGTSKEGLSKSEVVSRQEKYGPNELQKDHKTTPLKIFIAQFKNGLILLLVFAGILSLALNEVVESIAIFAIILLNAILGFIQEYRAEKAIEALEQITAPTTKVIRHGKEKKISTKNIVPGDIVVLEMGDIIPADGRIIEASSLQTNEASLTGESMPVQKNTEIIERKVAITEQKNMGFKGTDVTYGKGLLVITATGMETELGTIATTLQKTKEVRTPLQEQFTELTKQIGIIAMALIIIVLLTGFLQGNELARMILFALALTVSTIPNSLPIIVTVSLSIGTKNLADKNMLVKKLPAAESLGAATIICSDKTGTLTKNQMTITDIYSNGELIEVTGSGYSQEGKFSKDGKSIDPKKEMERFLEIGWICNNAKIDEKKIIGDPTEGSLLILAKKASLNADEIDKKYEIVQELPFDSDRKRMSVIVKDKKQHKNIAMVKGAPDLLLEKCTRILDNGKVRILSKKEKKQLLEKNDEFAERALRVLGLAYRELPSMKKYNVDTVEDNLIFVGLAGMIDPPREEVKDAIEKCKNAGIRVMIITGDHAITARAVAKKIGLFKEGDVVLTGDELAKMTDEELEKKIEKIRIIARALPIQKSRVVDALKKNGHIVAMTGDGVNDAPALKKADIGISMGITGTDVAKEVSKAILVDDNFATIVRAIEEGRNIYNKMIKSTAYLLSCNAGEITAVFMAIVLSMPLPLLPLQILMMNLLTDNFPALGLGAEPSDPSVMNEEPRDPKEKPITNKILISIMLFGIIMGAVTLYMFTQYLDDGLTTAQTIAFTTLVMFQMFAVLSSRTMHHSFKSLNPLTNKWLFWGVVLSLIIQVAVIYWEPLQIVFGTTAISLFDWVKITVVASLGFIMMEVTKFFLTGNKKVVEV